MKHKKEYLKAIIVCLKKRKFFPRIFLFFRHTMIAFKYSFLCFIGKHCAYTFFFFSKKKKKGELHLHVSHSAHAGWHSALRHARLFAVSSNYVVYAQQHFCYFCS